MIRVCRGQGQRRRPRGCREGNNDGVPAPREVPRKETVGRRVGFPSGDGVLYHGESCICETAVPAPGDGALGFGRATYAPRCSKGNFPMNLRAFRNASCTCCLVAAAMTAPATLSAQAAAAESPQLLAAATAPAVFDAATPAALPAAAEAVSSSSLPEDPSAMLQASQEPRASLPPTAPKDNTTHSGLTAPLYAKYIPSDESAQPLHAKQKIALGFRDLYAPIGFAGTLISAGYSQVTDGQPNYGTDRGAFGQRLGAAELRNISQGIFTDVLLHPLMRTDPRYYVKGPNFSFKKRTTYAVTRLFITRKDDGGATVNSPLLLGYLEAASMTRFYYPRNNKNFKDLMTGYGGSLGGAALGFVVTEFSDSFLKAVHLRHR